jgi:hypothetical protein
MRGQRISWVFLVIGFLLIVFAYWYADSVPQSARADV